MGFASTQILFSAGNLLFSKNYGGLICQPKSKILYETDELFMTSLYPDLAFSGSYTALITPFKEDGSLDEAKFEALVDWQIEEGTYGLVPVGTTGESPTLSHEEHDRIVEICVKVTNGRAPIIAGAGSNSTAEAVRLAQHA